MTDESKSDTSSLPVCEHGFLHECPVCDSVKEDENLCRLLNALEPLFESLEAVETNVLANWGTALPDSRIITIDAGTVRKIKAMAEKVRGMVE